MVEMQIEGVRRNPALTALIERCGQGRAAANHVEQLEYMRVLEQPVIRPRGSMAVEVPAVRSSVGGVSPTGPLSTLGSGQQLGEIYPNQSTNTIKKRARDITSRALSCRQIRQLGDARRSRWNPSDSQSA